MYVYTLTSTPSLFSERILKRKLAEEGISLSLGTLVMHPFFLTVVRREERGEKRLRPMCMYLHPDNHIGWIRTRQSVSIAPYFGKYSLFSSPLSSLLSHITLSSFIISSLSRSRNLIGFTSISLSLSPLTSPHPHSPLHSSLLSPLSSLPTQVADTCTTRK